MVRRIHDDEYERMLYINRICFADGRSADEWFSTLRQRKARILQGVWGCFDEAGDMTACLREQPYIMSFDGGRARAAGIAGVASMPESRNRGSVKRLFAALFEHLLQQGYTFSLLFPFSHTFYRRLGYDLCSRRLIHDFPIALLEPYAGHTGDVRLHRMSDGLDELNEVHSAHIGGYNMGIHRSADQWDDLMGGSKEAEQDNNYRYIFYENGQPVGYVLYTVDDVDEYRRPINIYDFAYTSADALYRIFGFLYSLRAIHAGIKNMDAPLDFDIHSLVAEPYQVSSRVSWNGMARILDVEAALAGMRHPQHGGSYSVKVEDAFFPANSGVYAVEDAGGRAGVKRRAGSADFACDINTLAQLVLGYLTIDQARLKPGAIQVNGNEDTLRKVFINKPLYMNDHF